MRAPLLALLLAGGGCLSSPDSAADGAFVLTDATEGLRFRSITLHPPPVATVTNIPIAIILPEDDDLAAVAREDGADIRVGEGPGGDELPHEIEAWNPDTGALTLWLLAPVVEEGTVLELRYGDGAERPQAPEAVWDDYSAVWHLAGDPDDVAPEMADSTGANPGSVVGAAPMSVPGIAGSALKFDGGLIRIPDDDSIDFGGTFSYELWVHIATSETSGQYDMAWFKGGSNVAFVGYDMELGSGPWTASLNDGATARNAEFVDDPVLDQWTHLVAVVDRQADELHTYLDGAPADSLDIGGLGTLRSEIDAAIGGSSETTNRLEGTVDEVRLRPNGLELAAISVQHANLRSPAEFLEVGGVRFTP